MGGEVLVLGIIAMMTWLIPFFGLPIPIIGLVWGIAILRRRPIKKGMTISGVVLSSIGLFLSLSYSVISVVSSPHPFQSFQPSDNSGAPPSTGPVAWRADGKIEGGEYDNSQTFGANFQLYWKEDGQFVYLGIIAPTTGWVSIGFLSDLRSGGMDVIMGYGGQTAAQGSVLDMWSSTQPNGTLSKDTDIGGQFSLLEWSALETIPTPTDEGNDAPFTVIEFRRRYITTDSCDMTLVSGPNLFIWAYSNSDDTRLAPSARGYGIFELR
jgi:hypothetical protein